MPMLLLILKVLRASSPMPLLVALVLSLVVSTAGCGDGAPSAAAPRQKLAQTALVPLAVGNTWTYSKTVPQGKHGFFQRTLLAERSEVKGQFGTFITTGRTHVRETDTAAVTCLETYKVVSPGDKEGVWQVAVTATPPACQGDNSENLRDGRYGAAQKIVWRTEAGVSPQTVGLLTETILFDRDSLPPGWQDIVVEPIQDSHDLALLWKILEKDEKKAVSHDLGHAYARNTSTFSSNFSSPIKTQVGSFDNCLEVHEEVNIQKGKDTSDPFSTGWITYRFFCHGVGLVKELQKDRAGDVLYVMDLIKYELSSPPKN